MDRICKLDILAPAQAELEEIARVHMALSGPRSAQEYICNNVIYIDFSFMSVV